MIKRTQILAIGLLVTLGITAPTATAKNARIASEVEISGVDFGDEVFENRVVGDVHSKKPKCERNRAVSLYFTPAGEERALLGTATTDRTGDWAVVTDLIFDEGSWDAAVTRRRIRRPGKDIVCKADASPPFVVVPAV
jgi:hypothetical protein